jgi:hypothetical protein
MTLPVLVSSDALMPSPLFPLIRTSVERMGLVSVLLLWLAGVLLGAFGAGPAWRLGLATMALFPLSAIAEMFVDGTSHNLWPLEFIIYGVLSIPAMIGAMLGRLVRNRLSGH